MFIHFSFFQCLKQYVELLIKEGLETAISCPDAACPKQGHLQENEACSRRERMTLSPVYDGLWLAYPNPVVFSLASCCITF